MRNVSAPGLLLAFLSFGLLGWGAARAFQWWDARHSVQASETEMVSSVQAGHLAILKGTHWEPRFWTGVNLGATTPGHFPGELSPKKADYLRWFLQMKEMNVDVVRIYTILPPAFYQALDEFNSGRQDPLWLLQGVWSPEEALIGDDRKGRDAYAPGITAAFRREITNAVRAVHGDLALHKRPGMAGGVYQVSVSRYLLGWIVGTEWYPFTVQVTNDAHAGMAPFVGTYFRATADASPFESWLARMLEVLAAEEMRYRSQHPVAFTNWPTTDPLRHPNEPFQHEDMVSVDPMHVTPTPAWSAGYFASYHVYPYYPDFLRFEAGYQTYRDAQGNFNPYAGYLHDLRAHHASVPVFISEFGVPSSRGMAHRGALGYHQGMHTETEQGLIDARLLESIYREGFDGAILFAWHDEWFKHTWNTWDLEVPSDRRPMWRNPLTNEEHFGVIAVEPGRSTDQTVVLDGRPDDWERRTGRASAQYPGFDLSVTHDEAYLYLLLRKSEGKWDFAGEELDIGFGTLPGGSLVADTAPGVTFAGGILFLLQIRGEQDARLLVNSAYDQHTWLYGEALEMLPRVPHGEDAERGHFLPWKLALSRALYLPATKQLLPFEDVEVGVLRFGRTDPAGPDYDSLADWYAAQDVLELRIPWMLLGFTDPSRLQVWNFPYAVGGIEPIATDGVNIYPVLRRSRDPVVVYPLLYQWKGWDMPAYHERKKASYTIMRQAFGSYTRFR